MPHHNDLTTKQMNFLAVAAVFLISFLAAEGLETKGKGCGCPEVSQRAVATLLVKNLCSAFAYPYGNYALASGGILSDDATIHIKIYDEAARRCVDYGVASYYTATSPFWAQGGTCNYFNITSIKISKKGTITVLADGSSTRPNSTIEKNKFVLKPVNGCKYQLVHQDYFETRCI